MEPRVEQPDCAFPCQHARNQSDFNRKSCGCPVKKAFLTGSCSWLLIRNSLFTNCLYGLYFGVENLSDIFTAGQDGSETLCRYDMLMTRAVCLSSQKIWERLMPFPYDSFKDWPDKPGGGWMLAIHTNGAGLSRHFLILFQIQL